MRKIFLTSLIVLILLTGCSTPDINNNLSMCLKKKQKEKHRRRWDREQSNSGNPQNTFHIQERGSHRSIGAFIPI